MESLKLCDLRTSGDEEVERRRIPNSAPNTYAEEVECSAGHRGHESRATECMGSEMREVWGEVSFNRGGWSGQWKRLFM